MVVVVVVNVVKVLLFDKLEMLTKVFDSLFEELLIWQNVFITENVVRVPNFVKSQYYYEICSFVEK